MIRAAKSTRVLIVALAAIVLAGLVLSGCTLLQSQAKVQPALRTIHMTALEYKGGTNSIPMPTAAPPAGKGYGIKAPDKDGRWETNTYRWEPGAITVFQGDTVDLQIWGVNGDVHNTFVEGYDVKFVAKRGQLTSVKFVADKVGMFKIVCTDHVPSMQGYLTVLPRT